MVIQKKLARLIYEHRKAKLKEMKLRFEIIEIQEYLKEEIQKAKEDRENAELSYNEVTKWLM